MAVGSHRTRADSRGQSGGINGLVIACATISLDPHLHVGLSGLSEEENLLRIRII